MNIEEIKNNPDNVHWGVISRYQKLSEDFIREFQDKIDWNYISYCQILSEDFIREFKNKVNWKYASLTNKFFRDIFSLKTPVENICTDLEFIATGIDETYIKSLYAGRTKSI